MLKLVIPDSEEIFDERTNEFRVIKGATLQLEHSLLSISKWEATWHKPFMAKNDKSNLEIIDYIRCMTLTQNVDPEVYAILTEKNLKDVMDYIEDPMTATTFSGGKDHHAKQFVTNELIYHSMIQYGIPFECQKWHINRLMTLIRVCAAEANGGKKMSQKDLIARHKAINAANRAKYNTRG